MLIAAQTASPILACPTTLTRSGLWTNADVTNPTTRTLNITGGAPGLFYFNTNQLYSPTVFNQTINFNAVERWTITNASGFSHSFHIHDVQFALISRGSAGAGPASVTGLYPYEIGWKGSTCSAIRASRSSPSSTILPATPTRLCITATSPIMKTKA